MHPAEVALSKMLLLTTSLVRQLVAFADVAWPSSFFSPFILTAWKLLARVQSEMLPLQRGSLADIAHLPWGRHSAAAWDHAGTLWIRLARRKNKPDGSTLSSPCECSMTGPQFCAACRLARWADIHQVARGHRLFRGVSAHSSQANLRQALSLLQVPAADAFGWRAIRRGRATELAKTPGVTLKQLMAAGEWSSRASSCRGSYSARRK